MNHSDHSALIRRLKCFNAKERYWVVHAALGHFRPSSEFLISAAKAAGVSPPHEECQDDSVFLAMDYHLNWLYAALCTAESPLPNARVTLSNQRLPGTERDKTSGLVGDGYRAQLENSQEDIDLLIAYLRADGVTQLILIEAKCVGTFTPGQLNSKFARLEGIFNTLGSKGFIDIKMLLMSPDRPPRRNLSGSKDVLRWPAWIFPDAQSDSGSSIPWLPLKTSSPDQSGFWFIKFGGSGKEDSETLKERQKAGANGARWYWPEPSLQHRKFGTMRKKRDSNE